MMKKIFTSLLMIFTCATTYALPVGNPAEASLFRNGVFTDYACTDSSCFNWQNILNVRLGFYGDYVYDRKMELNNAPPTVPFLDLQLTDKNRLQIDTNAAYVVMNICNRIDISTTLGTSSVLIRGNKAPGSGDIVSKPELLFDNRFSWSIGSRIALWKWNCFTLGIEGQYFQTEAELTCVAASIPRGVAVLEVFIDGSGLPGKNKITYNEWQTGLGVAYCFEVPICPSLAFSPYAAVKWAGSKLRMNWLYTQEFLFDMRSKKSIGYAVGLTLIVTGRAAVTLEGRWLDEKALYVNGQVRF